MHFPLFSDLWWELASFIPAFSQLTKLFLPPLTFTKSPVPKCCWYFQLSEFLGQRQLCLPGDAVRGSSDGTSWGSQHLTTEVTLSLDLGTGQPKNDPTFPPSCSSSYTAQHIKTSDGHNSYSCLICSLEKKKTKLLISIQQVGTSSSWQLSSLGQGQRK